MNAKAEKRNASIDVLKGMLITFVVLGHYPKLNLEIKNVIYWFHMPLFFIISGYLFKNNKERIWVIATIKKYLIPYIAYFVVVLIIERNFTLGNILRFLYGGRMYWGVYWFIPCLLITILLFKFLISKLSKRNVIIIVFIMYLMAHLEALFYLPSNNDYNSWSIIYKIPLNLDVCLISISYFAMGFYLKNRISEIVSKPSVYYLIISFLLCVTLMYLSVSKDFNYVLDLKYGQYKHVALDTLIPLMWGVLLLIISSAIKEVKILSFIGKNTLPIMYLHISINNILMKYFHYGIIFYLLIGIAVPIIFILICSRNRYLELIFKGKILKNT